MDDLIFVSIVNIPNFNFLACLEVAQKFVVEVPEIISGGSRDYMVGQVTTMSNLNPCCIELEFGFCFKNISAVIMNPILIFPLFSE